MRLHARLTDTCEVTLIDYMGDDLAVVNAARVSLAKKSTLIEDGSLREEDKRLIRYLAKHEHWTPFAQVQLKLHLKAPVFVLRQWYRHTIGVVRNEESRRYVDEQPAYFLPNVIRARPEKSIKQGSGGRHPFSESWRTQMEWIFAKCDGLYQSMIDDGVAPEQARIVLPLAHMSQIIETGSLAFFARCAALRLDEHAQKEIQDFMALVTEAVRHVAPYSWNALMKFQAPSAS